MRTNAEEWPPPWSAGDVRLLAEALGWPAVTVAGETLAGEAAWRRALDGADVGQCLRLHAALVAVEDLDDEEAAGT